MLLTDPGQGKGEGAVAGPGTPSLLFSREKCGHIGLLELNVT